MIALALGFSGCFSGRGRWRPTIDPRVSAHPEQEEADQDACRTQGRTYLSGAGTNALASGLSGAATGAGIGAVVGSFSGNAGKGAKMGAILGFFGGSSVSAGVSYKRYQEGYIACMKARGYRVID